MAIGCFLGAKNMGKDRPLTQEHLHIIDQIRFILRLVVHREYFNVYNALCAQPA